LQQLLDYENVCLTGGEPLLDMDTFKDVVEALQLAPAPLKLYLYASTYAVLDDLKWAMEHTHGLTWTVHQNMNSFDLIRFTLVQKHLDANKSNKLVIHSAAFKQIADFIDPFKWKRCNILYMAKDTCRLPGNEQLYVLKAPGTCVHYQRGGCGRCWVHCEPYLCEDWRHTND
jgi:hypothetical protein